MNIKRLYITKLCVTWMNTQTIIVAAVIIAAAVSLAIAPSASNVFASQPRDCFHRGNGDEIDCGDQHGNNAINCNRGGNQCTD
jgi:hypothetical protein